MTSKLQAGPLFPCTGKGKEKEWFVLCMLPRVLTGIQFLAIASGDNFKDGSGSSQGTNSKVNRYKVVSI